MYYNEEFVLEDRTFKGIKPVWGFGQFSEFNYYNNYSRTLYIDDVPYGQEDWHDTVLRVINGSMSIRKDWYIKNRIHWDESLWQDYAAEMAVSLTRMEWSPAGRGLWAMGTDLIQKRGAMALYNCAYTHIGEEWVDDLCWLMDVLMYGCGVGFSPKRIGLKLKAPTSTHVFTVPDSREGWVLAVRQLLTAFVYGGSLPELDVSLIRPEGARLRTFGGRASGPQPLLDFFTQGSEICYSAVNGEIDEIEFFTNLANLLGVCVIAGNMRRGAEIGIGDMDDPIFRELKDYDKYPHRAAYGWMSNNSVRLWKSKDFSRLDEIALANVQGHDLGYINMKNIPYGRLCKGDIVRTDRADGLNPCGEIPLEHREVCNLAETVPTRCLDEKAWLKACGHATFYCSTVALLPTHQPSTNAVVARNRRIGVSIIDYTGWKMDAGVAHVTRHMRRGYEFIRDMNHHLADEAGVPWSIRLTTMKPGGTVPKLVGRQAGVGHPTFTHTLFRVNVRKGTEMERVLIEAGVPYEESVYTPQTSNIFEFPVIQGPAEPATKVSIWEQAMNVVLLQREWADNAVSNTLYFKPRWSLQWQGRLEDENVPTFISFVVRDQSPTCTPTARVEYEHGTYKYYTYNPEHEEDHLEAVLSAIAPLTKSVSLLPHSDVGIFKQMPQEGITVDEYNRRVAQIKQIDWSDYIADATGESSKFCDSDRCTI